MSRPQRFGSSTNSRLGMPRLRSKLLTTVRRETQKLIIDDVDMTPKRLFSKVYTFMDEKQQSMFEFITGRSPSQSSMNLSRLTLKSSEVSSPAVLKSTGTVTQSLSMLVSWSDDTSRKSIEEQEIPSTRDGAPSMFWLPAEPKPKPLPPSVTITLTETPTFFFLDLISRLVPEESEELKIAAYDNEYYQNVKESLRKTATTAAQTINPVNIQRETLAVTNTRQNNSTFVCNYEMFDTFKRLEEQELKKEAERKKPDKVKVKEETESKAESMTESTFSINSETSDRSASEPRALDKELQTIVTSDNFQNACSKMERLLASNVFKEQQKVFRGLVLPDPLRSDVDFKYRLQLLWSFSSEYVKGKNVTGMCWNKTNGDLLAVSYGKYYYTDETKGMVCCWSIKNPAQPERIYTFDSPVTAIDFSKVCPNLLACGFYEGTVLVLDISSRQQSIVAQSDRETSPSYEPVWQVFWHRAESGYEEQIMSSCNDGRIGRYKRTKTLTYFPLMRISRVEGEVKGLAQLRSCKSGDIPVSRFSAALVLTHHPEDPLIYYVGTDEGCIHKCSTNYLVHHLDVFRAHTGPIYAMEFSPFCPKIFFTCGADWSIRIWCDGIVEPLLSLTEGTDPVQSAVWSPINSTIIASISGNNIHLWDIRRKTPVPASSITSPAKERNVMVQFTASGLNLVVADIEGNVHVFSLEDMPFSPFFQEAGLVEAIENALITQPTLLKLLKRVGKPFS